MNAFVRLAVIVAGPIVLVACGADEQSPTPTDTSGAIALDRDHAFSVTFDTGPCGERECGAIRSFDRATGVSTVLARVPGIGGNLALDDESVYFVSTTGTIYNEGGPSDTTNTVTTIGRVAKSGGPITVVATLPQAIVRGLVVRDASVFFTVSYVARFGPPPSLSSVPKAGGAIAVLATFDAGAVTQVVADDSFVYWALRTTGEKDEFVIRRTPFAGEKEPSVFAHGEGWLEGMTIDDTGLYVTNHGPTPTTGFEATEGSVVAISFAGTQRTLASGIRNVGAIAAFGSRVAWATWSSAAPDPAAPKGEVRSMPKTGGDQTSLVQPFVAGSLSADDAGICATALFAASVVCVKR